MPARAHLAGNSGTKKRLSKLGPPAFLWWTITGSNRLGCGRAEQHAPNQKAHLLRRNDTITQNNCAYYCLMNDQKIYDVAIIGAGPAGSFLAYQLSVHGLRVALFEKEKLPRIKTCAGGLSAKISDILPFDITPVIQKKIYGATVSHKFQHIFTKYTDKLLIFTVDRGDFDHYLVQYAEKKGAHLFDEERIKDLREDGDEYILTSDKQEIRCKIAIGADGAQSFLARKISLNPISRSHFGLQTEIPLDALRPFDFNTIRLDFGRLRDGYFWVFPKKETASVGVIGRLRDAVSLRPHLSDWLKLLGVDPDNVVLRGHSIPHRITHSPVSFDRIFLIGDAAGAADYWTGEGIYYALKTAQMLAGHIAAYFAGDQHALAGYERAMDRETLSDLRSSYYFSQAFNYLSAYAFKLIKNNDYPWDVFCRIMRGERTFSELQQRLKPHMLLNKIFNKKSRGR